jgi:glycine hydroxymethyltransferase
MHVVAGKAVCFAEALLPSFRKYGEQVIANSQILAEVLLSHGLRLISGGTDNHLVLVDVTSFGIGGKVAEKALEHCGITVNMNMIPFDTRKPMDPSGIRIGSPALTTRGMGGDEFRRIGHWIATALKSSDNVDALSRIHQEVRELANQFPVPASGLATIGAED